MAQVLTSSPFSVKKGGEGLKNPLLEYYAMASDNLVGEVEIFETRQAHLFSLQGAVEIVIDSTANSALRTTFQAHGTLSAKPRAIGQLVGI